MRFEQRIEVPADAASVWAFLWDVERLARCLPGCQEAREVEPGERYSVVTEERVGPFRARFEMDVRVVERVAGRLVRLRAEGRDRKLAASTRVELEVALEEGAGGGTALSTTADIVVMGKIAGLGQSVIKRKAQDVVTRFAQAMASELGGRVAGG